MAIIPKTKTVQFRVEAELFDNFSREVDLCDQGVTVSAILRSAMKMFIADRQRRRKTEISNAEWAATLESRRKAALAAEAEKKPPVGPVNKPMSLSEKRKAEKAAKEARRARKEDRY